MLSITNSGKHAHERRRCDPHFVVLLNVVIHDHDSLFYFSIYTDLYMLFHIPRKSVIYMYPLIMAASAFKMDDPAAPITVL